MKKITLIILFFAFSITVKAQTYLTEGFNTSIPSSWTVTDEGDPAGGTWFSGNVNGNALNGTNAAVVNSDAEGNNPHPQLIETLTSPIVDTSGAVELYLEFHQYFNNLSSDSGVVEVFDGNNWVELLNQSSDVGGLNAPDIQQINITAYSNPNLQVRFIYNDNDVWAWYWIIDNVSIYNTTCANPTGISVSGITQTEATINWTPNGVEASWEVSVQQAGLPAPTGSGTPVSAAPTFNATGLISNNNYDVYVRNFCGGGNGFSNWAGPIQFQTAAAPAPISFTTSTINTNGTIRAVVDMNGDHLDDIVAVTATNIHIQQQHASGGFTAMDISTPQADFTPSWSLAAADFDGNGFTDLLYGAGSGVTFMKADATGSNFTEISSQGLNIFSQRSNFIDVNNDGNLDAFVCHDVAPNVYFLNDGSGNLTLYQTTNANAPYNLGDYSSGGNYGSIWVDYDNDGDQDMFIAKCGGEVARRTNQMHTNNGLDSNNITTSYTENAAALNLADPMQTWSSAWGDFDNDGDMDVFVGASSGTHKLMRNDLVVDDITGAVISVSFTEVTGTSGVSTLTDTGIENVTFDFDNDGNLDIASNGNILFGNGDMTFSVYENVVAGRGSFGDLNDDGFIDNFSENGTLYTNDTNSNNWIKINTVGTASNLDGIGARIILETASGKQIRDVRSGDGFRFMNSINTHFGIGTESTITSITINWPSGMVDQINNPNTNQSIVVVEGSNPLSVEDYSVADLILYPNPTTGVLNLNSNNYQFDNAKYSVFDMVGRLVKQGKFSNKTINVSALDAGNYILQISANRSVKTQKFIKK